MLCERVGLAAEAFKTNKKRTSPSEMPYFALICASRSRFCAALDPDRGLHVGRGRQRCAQDRARAGNPRAGICVSASWRAGSRKRARLRQAGGLPQTAMVPSSDDTRPLAACIVCSAHVWQSPPSACPRFRCCRAVCSIAVRPAHAPGIGWQAAAFCALCTAAAGHPDPNRPLRRSRGTAARSYSAPRCLPLLGPGTLVVRRFKLDAGAPQPPA